MPSRCSRQHPSSLQQRHQKHLKIAPKARATCQLSCCPLLAPPCWCCLHDGGTMLARRQGSREWDGSEAACSSSGSWRMAAAVLPGGVKGQWGPSLCGPLAVQQLHLVSAKGRWSGICDNRLSPAGWGHSAAHVLETPVVEFFQPGVISYLLAEKGRGPGASLAAACSAPSHCPPVLAGKSLIRMLLVRGGTPHLAETC